MAISYFYNSVPKTAAYIDTLKDAARTGHHNYVIEQRFLNTYPAFDFKTETQKRQFDNDCLQYLYHLDTMIDEKTGEIKHR